MTDSPFALRDRFPTVGQATKLTGAPDGTEVLRVTFQPDARTAQIVEMVPVSQTSMDDGMIPFTPTHAGIMRVEAQTGCSGSQQAVTCKETLGMLEASVKFDGIPASGIAICLVAAFMLFGGSAWALRQILRSD